MHGVVVKQGFAVMVAFCYNICLFKKPVITILKVVGREACVQENKLSLWGPGGEAHSCLAILAIFLEETAI